MAEMNAGTSNSNVHTVTVVNENVCTVMVMDVTLTTITTQHTHNMNPVCIGPYVMSHMHSYSYDHTISWGGVQAAWCASPTPVCETLLTHQNK